MEAKNWMVSKWSSKKPAYFGTGTFNLSRAKSRERTRQTKQFLDDEVRERPDSGGRYDQIWHFWVITSGGVCVAFEAYISDVRWI